MDTSKIGLIFKKGFLDFKSFAGNNVIFAIVMFLILSIAIGLIKGFSDILMLFLAILLSFISALIISEGHNKIKKQEILYNKKLDIYSNYMNELAISMKQQQNYDVYNIFKMSLPVMLIGNDELKDTCRKLTTKIGDEYKKDDTKEYKIGILNSNIEKDTSDSHAKLCAHLEKLMCNDLKNTLEGD